MLICFGVLNSLPAQSQKISIERAQLVELTKKAEKAALYEDENTRLIVENYNLKTANKTLNSSLSNAQKEAKTYKDQRNKIRWALSGLLLAVVVSIVLRIKKIFL